jgi:hypothetical protein
MANGGISLGTRGDFSLTILNWLKMLESDSSDRGANPNMICEEQLHLK